MLHFLAQQTSTVAPTTESNTALYAMKYAGSIFAALYGLYATITDFHEQREGKKVLSRKGYFGIVLLFVASILSISADAYKDRREEREKIEQKQHDIEARNELNAKLGAELEKTKGVADQLNLAVQTLDQTATTSRGVLNQTERILQPIKDVSVSYEVLVPTDDPSMKGIVGGIKVLETPMPVPGGLVCPRALVHPPDPNVPSIAHDVLGLLVLSVSFYRQKITPRKNLTKLGETSLPGYTFETVTQAGSNVAPGIHLIYYDPHGNLTMLVSHAQVTPADYERRTFEISSIPDLLKSHVLITVEPHIRSDGTGWVIRRRLSISKLALHLSGEQEPFVFIGKNVKPILNEDGYPVYYGEFSQLFHQGPTPFGPQRKCD
jgi:hypothetical protein